MTYRQFDYTPHLAELVPLLKKLTSGQYLGDAYARLIKKHAKKDGRLFAKDELLVAMKALSGQHGLPEIDDELIKNLQLKPTRTMSGVTPITVLTKPFPCPGKCIFCPSDIRMPKSYLSDEPGAQRAERNYFDPYLQTYNRLQALDNIGHPVSKAEVIVLGGTWSFYSVPYQLWFIKECFRALNDYPERDDRERLIQQYQVMSRTYQKSQDLAPSSQPEKNKELVKEFEIDGQVQGESYNQVVSKLYVAPEKRAGFDRLQTAEWQELEAEQVTNETASARCVGLVIETRPDNISEAEVERLRRLGCTKTQIGVQSLQDEVLEKNKRGHDVAATRRAFALLRRAGFKIHAHWMANLHGSNVEKDKADFERLFSDPDFHPDELKIYPCSLIGSAELMQYYRDGRWRPYTQAELLEVVTHTLKTAPRYTRLTRVIRDIPSTDIVEGNKLTNFRQVAEQELIRQGSAAQDIRAREIRGQKVEAEKLEFKVSEYQTSVSRELFLEYLSEEKLVGFLRLSFPTAPALFPELEDSAMIREVHVYGPSLRVGLGAGDKAQHAGVGTALLHQAFGLAREAGFAKLAVISAIGTREYYRSRGFKDGRLYQHYDLSASQK